MKSNTKDKLTLTAPEIWFTLAMQSNTKDKLTLTALKYDLL